MLDEIWKKNREEEKEKTKVGVINKRIITEKKKRQRWGKINKKNITEKRKIQKCGWIKKIKNGIIGIEIIPEKNKKYFVTIKKNCE